MVPGIHEEAAAAFDGLDEEQLDEGAWGDPELELGGGEESGEELGEGLGPESGDEGEGGWEMEVRWNPPVTTNAPAPNLACLKVARVARVGRGWGIVCAGKASAAFAGP